LARLVAGHEFVHRGDAGQSPGALPRRHGERAQRPRPDVLDRRQHWREVELHLSADEIDQRGPSAAIRHVHKVDAGHHLEQLPDRWDGAPLLPADAIVTLPGLALA
jgi:hypothetical protein